MEIVCNGCFLPSTEIRMLRFGQVTVANVHSLLANEISEGSCSLIIVQKVSTNRRRQASFSVRYREPRF